MCRDKIIEDIERYEDILQNQDYYEEWRGAAYTENELQEIYDILRKLYDKLLK